MHLIRGRLKCFGKEAKDSREADKALDVNCDLVTEITAVAGYTKGIDEREKERKGMNMSVLIVSKNNFDTIKNSEKPVLLDFYADWCAPCRMMSPLVDEIAEENPQYLVGKINVDKEPELAIILWGSKHSNTGCHEKRQGLKQVGRSTTQKTSSCHVRGLIPEGASYQGF